MKKLDYVQEAHKTASDKFYGERVPLALFITVSDAIISASENLDCIKKALFYGKEFPHITAPEGQQTLESLPAWLSPNAEQDGAAINLIHGIIGKVTEAAELLEALQAVAKEGKPFDTVNAIEEIGDGLWYDALALKALGSTFEEAQQINIAKLRRRFPEKFTEESANNRNLEEERKILEKGVDNG